MDTKRSFISVGLTATALLWGVAGCLAQTAGPVPAPTAINYDLPNYANSPLPILSGSLTGIRVTDVGCGYSAAPKVTIDPPAAGTPATATATVGADHSISIALGNPGTGYNVVPNVTVELVDTAGNPITCSCPASAVAIMGVQANTGMRKFLDGLPGLGPTAANNLGQFIPVAVANTPYGVLAPYPGSDYYEIAVVDYRERMHSDLPATGTLLRGYVQLVPSTYPGAVALTTANGLTYDTADPANPGQPYYGAFKPHYLGPIIVATKNVPTRIKFYNLLPAGASGDLFIPVDTTIMGAGVAGWAQDPVTGTDSYTPGGTYPQNRATLHLHGGFTPWVSDGTPHQWTVPLGDLTTVYQKGVSSADVPDMPASGQGVMTFYYPNQQSGRLMFYHDHAYGITRLNVYAGEAAGYLLVDPDEEPSLASAGVPADQIPLVIQDKTFVWGEKALAATPTGVATDGTYAVDPLWNSLFPNSQPGDLWFPHVYMANQNPLDLMGGANPLGRWDYGPWFWPPQTVVDAMPEVSTTPESFMDTPVVNGTAYPYAEVQPQKYRLRILNACNDRFLNLQLYQADPNGAVAGGIVAGGNGVASVTLTTAGAGYTAPAVAITGGGGSGAAATVTGPVDSLTLGTPGVGYTTPVVQFTGGGGSGATATASGGVDGITLRAPSATGYTAPVVDIAGGGGSGAAVTAGLDTTSGAIISFTITDPGSGYTSAPTVTITDPNVAVALATASISITSLTLVNGGSDYSTAPGVTVTDAAPGSNLILATATSTVGVTGITLLSGGSGYTTTPAVSITDTGAGVGAAASVTIAPFVGAFGTEVAMVQAVPNPAIPFPDGWKVQTPGMLPEILDGRPGGVPDPRLRGPAIIQIGTEGGLLPGPVLLNNTPVGYEQNKRNIVVLNVSQKTLFLGPAERADVVIDFSKYAGKTVILYNDSPAPVPAGDPRLAYYTGNEDYSSTAGVNNQGGAPSTLPGYGPNMRTIMQFRVGGTPAPNNPPLGDDYDTALLTALNTTLPNLFNARGEIPIVPEPDYPPTVVGYSATPTYSKIQDNSLTFIPVGGIDPITRPMQPKAIHELFDTYGRMNSVLGVELPFTSWLIQTTIPYQYIDPVTESIPAGQTQIWKITHNGVDTHAIHFHLVNVQVINRVGWDGAIRPPDPNELGWKETVRMNPLEDCIVAATAKPPGLPFLLPKSSRVLDVTAPLNSTGQFTGVNPQNGTPLAVANLMTDFDWEYVWHCHLLGHEENDMMRPLVMRGPVGYTPTVTATFVPPLPASGWYTVPNASVTVNLAAFDFLGGPGIGSITVNGGVPSPGNTTTVGPITAAGSTVVSFFATDLWGITSVPKPQSVTVNIDETAPAAPTVATVPAANAAGWNKANVTGIALTASDTGSGLAAVNYTVTVVGRAGSTVGSVPAAALAAHPLSYTTGTITLPGGNITVNGTYTINVAYTITDTAGNSTTGTTPLSVKLDKAAPTTTAATVTPAANPAGWIKAAAGAVVTMTGTDTGGSGIASVTYSATGAQATPATTVPGTSATLNITAQGATTVSFFVTDAAGNTSTTRTVPVVRVDNVPPTIVATCTPASVTRTTTGNQTVTVSGSVSESAATALVSGVANGTYTITDSNGVAFTGGNFSVNQATAVFSFNRSLPRQVVALNPNRVYTFTLSVTDRAGNGPVTTTATFTVN